MLSFKPTCSLSSFTLSRGSSVLLRFLPLGWCHLSIYITEKSKLPMHVEAIDCVCFCSLRRVFCAACLGRCIQAAPRASLTRIRPAGDTVSRSERRSRRGGFPLSPPSTWLTCPVFNRTARAVMERIQASYLFQEGGTAALSEQAL